MFIMLKHLKWDKQFFDREFDKYFTNDKLVHRAEGMEWGRAVLTTLQTWVESKDRFTLEYSSKTECRADLAKYLYLNLNPRDRSKPWYTPNFAWDWISKKISAHFIALVIEMCWSDT